METIRALIISDGKPGHLNQSIALCKYKNWDFEIVTVSYKKRWMKALSYIFDHFGIYTESIFKCNKTQLKSDLVIATGSTTYYPAKVMAKKLKAKSIAIMLPKGYRHNFDYIIAQSHDNPPKLDNIIELPINLAMPTSTFDEKEMSNRFIFDNSEEYVGIVVGGPNQLFSMSIADLQPLFDYLLSLGESELVVTTSRRTPPEIDEWLLTLPLRFLLLYSKENFNPIPAFLTHCKHVVITSDSTSMISESTTYGNASIDVFMLPSSKRGKFHKLIQTLEQMEVLHVFDGKLGNKNKKIELKNFLDEVVI